MPALVQDDADGLRLLILRAFAGAEPVGNGGRGRRVIRLEALLADNISIPVR